MRRAERGSPVDAVCLPDEPFDQRMMMPAEIGILVKDLTAKPRQNGDGFQIGYRKTAVSIEGDPNSQVFCGMAENPERTSVVRGCWMMNREPTAAIRG